MKDEIKILRIIRILVIFFMFALAVSGITAFPVETELKWLMSVLPVPEINSLYSILYNWILKVLESMVEINRSHPFLAYGFDWLAFAHLIIAISFIGVYRKPVRNIWIVYWAMIACVAVIPLALICGHIREIPVFWRLIDCSFGVFGIIPLYILYIYIRKLQRILNLEYSI